MHSTTCLDPMGEENDQVGLTVSPIRGLGPRPAPAGYMQQLMGSLGRGPRLSLQNHTDAFAGEGIQAPGRAQLVPTRKPSQET